jgi:large subunit ribosomal protein L23
MKLFDRFKKKPKSEKEKEKKEIKKESVKLVKEEEKKPTKIKSRYPEAYRVLIKPIVSEKATDLGMYNQYVFEVAKKANKIEIKKAIEAIYGVRPTKVNIIKVKGKRVRFGRVEGRTKAWKKAIVTLRQGERIEVFEKG